MSDIKNKNRIWELDFFRGLFLWGVIFVHVIVDITIFTPIQLEMPEIFTVIKNYGGILFVILSGICVTLGHRCIKRGIIVFSAGILVSLVTYLLFQNTTSMVWFGILHLLGICMLIYPLIKKLPAWILPLFSAVIIILGYWFTTFKVQSPYLFPFGLITYGFGSGDYWPLFPQLGYFILGVFIGKIFYREKKTCFPGVNTKNPVIRFFSFCGRHSLWIYLGHQPVAYVLVMLFLA